MLATIRNWKQCASVSAGGKPYFYVSFDDKGKLTVVWNRIDQRWMITRNDTTVAQYFRTTKQAYDYIEANNL
jgi:hypothetical protein